MTKKMSKRLLSLFMFAIMVLSFGSVAFASENTISNDSEDIEIISVSAESYVTRSVNNETIKYFSGTYTGWLDVPFTVTDSSRPVKVLYSIKSSDGNTLTTHLGVRMESSDIWFWSKLNLSGNQIQEIGKLKTGNYVLRIKPGSITDTYKIAGEIYYFG